MVKALYSQSRSPVFETTGWLQSRLSLSSFLGLSKKVPGISRDLKVKSKLSHRSREEVSQGS